MIHENDALNIQYQLDQSDEISARKLCGANKWRERMMQSSVQNVNGKWLNSVCGRFFADVRIIYHRECSPLVCPSFSDLQGPWPEQAPVCASNGYTYGHIHQVRCLKDLQPGKYRIPFTSARQSIEIVCFSLLFITQIFEFFMKAAARCMKRIVRSVEMLMWKRARLLGGCSKRMPFVQSIITRMGIHLWPFARPAVWCMFAKKLAALAEVRCKRVAKKCAKCRSHWRRHRSPSEPSF